MHTTLTHIVKYMQTALLAGCFLALALLPAFPLCDLMQVLPHFSISPSLFYTLSISISLCFLSLFPILFFTLLLSFLFLLYFDLPFYVSHNLSLFPLLSLSHLYLSLTLACIHCLSPPVSLSHCRVRSGNSLFVMFIFPFPRRLIHSFYFCPRTVVYPLAEPPMSMVYYQFATRILIRCEHYCLYTFRLGQKPIFELTLFKRIYT